MPFPIINIEGAKKCPSCGSEKLATSDYIAQLKKGLYLPKNFDEDCLQMQIPFMMALNSPLNIQQQIPILIINFAICSECFTQYVTKLTSGGSIMQQQPGQRQPPMGAR